MKNNFSMLLATVMLLLAFCSCNKKNEVYSCNPQINTWVKEHRNELQNLTRAQLAAYQSIDSQFAIYRILTPEAKYAVWKRKMEIVINEYGLTDAENAHIRTALNYAKPDLWNENNNELKNWGVNWESKAISQLGWDTAKTVLIAETWLTGSELNHLKELKDKATVKNTNAADRAYIPPPPPDCNCNYSVFCSLSGNGVCLGGCAETNGGCGFWGSSNCGGRCG